MMTMTTITTITDNAALRLLAWLSPAFPTGGFAWSHGVEWAVESGDITNTATLTAWVESVLRHGAGRSDAILLRHAHRAHANLETLVDLANLARATAPTAERRAEAAGQGNAFVKAATPWNPTLLTALTQRVEAIPYAIAVGALAGAHAIPEDITTAATLQAFAANLISAAVRLVPLGQSAGLASLAALEPIIAETAAVTRTQTLDDIGGCAFRSDLAAMRHETQYTRLFRS